MVQDEAPPPPEAPAPAPASSASATSTMASPQSGRPDHLKSLIQRNQSTRAGRMVFASAILEGIGEDGSLDDDEEKAQQQQPPALASEVSATATTTNSTSAGSSRPSRGAGLTPAQQRVSRRMSQYTQRQSVYQAQAPERLVEVRLRDVSYHVPVKMDAPSVKTVANQSVCYGAFEFFRRLHQFCQRGTGRDGAAQQHQQWKAKTSSDVVSPYGQKAILHSIDLVLKPGKVYLILGPPGCGKTTLLKCIAGLLPDAAAHGAEPKKNQAYQSGRVEFNGVATQVSQKGAEIPSICLQC